jgi:hypothetical protein
MDEKEKLQEIDVETQVADGKKQSFFSRLVWKRKRKKEQKIEELQQEQQLSEEETKIVEEKLDEAIDIYSQLGDFKDSEQKKTDTENKRTYNG